LLYWFETRHSVDGWLGYLICIGSNRIPNERSRYRIRMITEKVRKIKSNLVDRWDPRLEVAEHQLGEATDGSCYVSQCVGDSG